MNPPHPAGPGCLDGLTLVRFAHAFSTGGGMERILDDLDGILLRRNAMTIIRMFIARRGGSTLESSERCGRGELFYDPLPLADQSVASLAPDEEPHGPTWKQRLRDRLLYNPVAWRLGGRRYVLARPVPRRRGDLAGAGACFERICQHHAVGLCMMHFFGGADADEVIAAARRRHIPVALENHFSNDRFLHASMRKHAMLAQGIGGMNALQVPGYLQSRLVDLADGIDLALFDRKSVRPLENPPNTPVLLLPARIVRPKGQLDLVHAAALLRDCGLNATVVLAGRVDSPAFAAELRAEVQRRGLENDVRFVGELTPEALRDWLGVTAVLAFPTLHHEGLGRVIIEAQAMQVPVVAYASGGVPEGMIDGRTGFLVPPGDRGALAERIAELLRHPQLGLEMGREGRRFVSSRYSLESLAERHEAFYLSVLEASRPGRREPLSAGAAAPEHLGSAA